MNRKQFLGAFAYWYHVQIYGIHIKVRWSSDKGRYEVISFEHCTLPVKSCIMDTYPYRLTMTTKKQIEKWFSINKRIDDYF